MAAARREIVEKNSGHLLFHTGQFSIPPDVLLGNIEGSSGIVQVPMGLARPLLVNSEHAHGEFYVPMATIKGTLVACYNRGMTFKRHDNGDFCQWLCLPFFMASGQVVANVAESSAGFLYSELLDNGDYYFSVTIPSFIVATYGGGTELPTQCECLRRTLKLAEVIAATVFVVSFILSSAIVSDQWVSKHDTYGRNRP